MGRLSSQYNDHYFVCNAEVEQSSYEDDLQILRVIEAYCTSKQRQTITNSGELILNIFSLL